MGFFHAQQCALQEDWDEEAMYQKLCHFAMKHGEPVEGNAKGGIQRHECNLWKEFSPYSKVILVEETISNDSNV